MVQPKTQYPNLSRTHSRFLSRTGIATLAAITVAALFAGQHAEAVSLNLITNGNFATNGGPGQLTVNTTLANWTGGGKEGNFGSQTTPPVFVFPTGIYSANGDAFMGNVSFYGVNGTTPPPSGGPFVGLDADPSWNGSLSQTISGLTIGQTYTLTFNWAGAQQVGFSGNTTEDFQVSLGSATQSTSTVSTPSQGFDGWQTASMNFTPTATSQLLNFAAKGTPSGQQPWALLSNVSMTAAVPEPGSFALIGATGLFVAGFRRHRKAA